MFQIINSVVWKGSFQGQFENKAHAIETFEQNIETVKQLVPPERLLVYEVGEGWEPLCRFLAVPAPTDKPFPHANTKAEFDQMIRGRKQIAFLMMCTLVGLIGFLAELLARFPSFPRTTSAALRTPSPP